VDSGKRHAIVSADDINNYVSIADREWKRIGVSMKDRRPDLWKNADAVITSLRIDDFFSRDFQKNDVREVYSRQSNAIIGYDMGLGKTRFSLALALLGGKHNLIVVPAHLVDEVMLEVKACGLTDQSHVIQSSHDVSHLKKINIISYSCLKKPLGGFRKPTQDASDEAKSDEKDDDSDDTKPGVAWRTIGDLLRNRIHTVICDEAHVLSNKKSQQTQAVMRVGGRRRYALTGTPIQNYVRNLTGLMTWIGGDGTCRQPFGFKRPFITPYLYKNTAVSERGQDVFAERHVTLEWVTHEFRDDLESGAKREIPKVKNAKALQDVLAPLMLRRSVDEPDVSKYFHVPKPTVTSVKVAWNTDHLIHYYKVCTEFKNWYVSSENKHNLAQVLIKIRAVDNAANIPFINGPGGLFHGTSSKMESALQRIKEWVHDGHRVIVGSQRPAISLLIANGLNAMGIETIAHHGQIPIHKRNKTLYAKFVNGTTPVLSATIQSLQTGYNLWMADRVLMLEHDWTSKSEDQFIRRVLRPQQKKQVEVEFMELDGSIDVYKGQMAGQKRTTSQLIIDHEGDESNQEDFKHMEHILYDFVKGTDGLQAMLEDRVKK
jgi:SNF2 family DNA or RNA helicase